MRDLLLPFSCLAKKSSSRAFSMLTTTHHWSHWTVEWSPQVAAVQSDLLPTATHFVFPDLPQAFSAQDRDDFLMATSPQQRIQTVATCRHESWQSLVQTVKSQQTGGATRVLLVGGNNKSDESFSTEEAARILQSEMDCTSELELWGVANPNDPHSTERVGHKVEAGISRFLTQPLLSSTAMDTLTSYASHEICLVAGMALPQTAKSLQFWSRLLDQPDDAPLSEDPLFQNHLAFFSQPFYTPLAWIGREVEVLLQQDGLIDGIHFMPLKNTQDLVTIFRSLERLRSSLTIDGGDEAST